MSHGSGVGAVVVGGGTKNECGCVLWESPKLHCGCREEVLVPLCDPGIQSHALDVSSLLVLFVRRPEELGRRAEVGRHGPAGRTCRAATSASTAGPTASSSSRTCSATSGRSSVVAVAAFEGAGVAAYAVCGRAAGRGLQAQQGAGVLRRSSQDGTSRGRGWRGRRRRARGAAIPAGRDGLRFDAHAGVCVDGQHGTLRDVGHRPENGVTEAEEEKWKEDKGQNKDEKQETIYK